MSSQVPYSMKGDTSDESLISVKMDIEYESGYIHVEYFSDSNFSISVTPTGGTIIFTGSEDGISYGTFENGTVSATDPEYGRPHFSGPVRFVKAEKSGITGAAFFKATIIKYRR